MKPPRLLIRTAIVIVALAAIDFAAMRMIFGKAMTFGLGLQALITTIPIGLAMNFGLIQILRTRGRPRLFWGGFLLFGTIAMATAAWAALTPAGSASSTTGGANRILHGSKMWFAWNSYFIFTEDCLEALGFSIRSFIPRSLDNPGIAYVTTVGLVAFVPQLAVALLGGLIGRSLTQGGPVSPERSSPGRSTGIERSRRG
jgi:hypothetical protein